VDAFAVVIVLFENFSSSLGARLYPRESSDFFDTFVLSSVRHKLPRSLDSLRAIRFEGDPLPSFQHTSLFGSKYVMDS